MLEVSGNGSGATGRDAAMIFDLAEIFGWQVAIGLLLLILAGVIVWLCYRPKPEKSLPVEAETQDEWTRRNFPDLWDQYIKPSGVMATATICFPGMIKCIGCGIYLNPGDVAIMDRQTLAHITYHEECYTNRVLLEGAQ